VCGSIDGFSRIDPDISVYFEEKPNDLARIEINSGTTPAGDVEGETPYEAGAIIPKDDWSPLTHSDRQILVDASPPERFGQAISIIRVPSHLLEAFHKLSAAGEFLLKESLFSIVADLSCQDGVVAISR